MTTELHDEHGKLSMGRKLLAHWTGAAFVVIAADVIMGALWSGAEARGVPGQVYTLFVAVLPILILWVALPRAGATWAPAIAGLLAAIPSALAMVGRGGAGNAPLSPYGSPGPYYPAAPPPYQPAVNAGVSPGQIDASGNEYDAPPPGGGA